MKTLLIILLAVVVTKSDTTLFDFNDPETSGKWYIVNDDVMGGISTSKLVGLKSGIATFSGSLSPENNGGFASVRSRVENTVDTKYNGVKVRIKGDGNTYSLRFRTNQNFDGYAYQAKFKTVEGEWLEIELPFSTFKPTFRGFTLSGKPELQPQNIGQIGILIADYQFGEFSLDIDWIKFYE